MSHRSKISLYQQVCNELESKFVPGRSKHADKAGEGIGQYIYSYSTLEAYKRHAGYFVAYCKREHGCKTLNDCRQYVDEWILSRADLSAYTLKSMAAALAKLYGCSSREFARTPARRRSDIKRSRGPAERDRHFSVEKNREIVEFCKSTGLRRRELQMLTGDKLIEQDGRLFILVDRGGKGGKVRLAPVIGDQDNVLRCMRRAGSGRVWERVPVAMDVHSYRSEYATAIYRQYARAKQECLASAFWNPERRTLEPNSLYRFRKDRAGEWLDKAAMLEASRALGHNRITVVAEHYIR